MTQLVDVRDSLFFQSLEKVVAENKATQALVDGNQALTFSDVLGSVHRITTNLVLKGFRPGESVGINVKDEVHHFLLSLALLALGTRQTTFSTHDPEAIHIQLKHRLGITKVISDSDMKRFLESTAGNEVLPGITVGESGLLVLKTSGTVNRAKLVPTDVRSLLIQASQHNFYQGSRFLRLASIEHNNSKRHRLYCLLQGGTNLFRESDSQNNHRDFLIRSSCTRFDIARSHFASLLAQSSESQIPEPIAITVAGSPVPSPLRAAFQEKVTANLFVRYGATEVGTISIAGPTNHEVEGGVGVILNGVRHNANQDLKELIFRTPGMATQYLDPVQGQELGLSVEGFRPGDLGFMTKDGQLVIRGRVADAFTLDGVNIFPREIEAVLLENSKVTNAAVVMKSSKNHDGLPVAYVVESPGERIDSLDLLAWAKVRMGLAAPRKIIVIAEIPTTDQGKVDYETLKNNST